MASPELAAIMRRLSISEADGPEEESIDAVLQRRKASQQMDSAESNELSQKLDRRRASEDGEVSARPFKVFNPYTEFKEFSRKEIQNLNAAFKKYDEDQDKYLGLSDLKLMMEKLGVPQTHLGLKAMIKEVDEDGDGKISFREFLLIFRKARSGELSSGDGLMDLYQRYMEMESIEVAEVGVGGAKDFFESKIAKQTRDKAMENEIREEQNRKALEEEEKRIRREKFKERAALFH